ncbi:MAG TPA: AAA family ATPase [Phycisphaerae bacterium]|nr:AAA family ATPase [Phycisphaerae bacterium]
MSEANGPRPPFLKRLRLKDYKSIAKCDIALSPFTALVGPNGAGKSNLIDSLRFVTDSLRNSLEFALRERGGIGEVRRRSKGHPRYFVFSLEMNLPSGNRGFLAFQVGVPRPGAFNVMREFCQITEREAPFSKHFYDVRGGKLQAASRDLTSAIEPDRLYLQAVSGVPEFRPIYDALTHMGFYNLNPERIRDLQEPDPAEVLSRDGRNLASILKRLEGQAPEAKKRIEEYLEVVVPGVRGVGLKALGPKETVEFRQVVPGDDYPWHFLAANMSDGTLRALGVLVALFQGAFERGGRVPLVGVEEPEVALHPAATNALAGAILEATMRTQVLVTSHSPDLLDNPRVTSDNILAVVSENGETVIGQIDEAARESLKKQLYTPGELLRIQQIEPDRRLFLQSVRQRTLFPREIPV